MARQRRLFPEPATTVRVDPSRLEPTLWVRRLIVWAKPGEILREVRLRRGLNIVWSPDPGISGAVLGSQEGSGHGAGKSLFCRLLRYCLGEDTFANEELRNRIGTTFPEGLVGAELVVGGTIWAIVRPIGMTRKILAGEGTPEDLLAGDGHGVSTKPLMEAIDRTVLRQGIEKYMPGNREWRAWLLALAWLARDQECRFGHILEWRHTDAGSRSPALGLSKEDLLTAVRLLIDTMAVDEMEARRKLDSLHEGKRNLESEASFLSQLSERTGRALAATLAIDPSLLTAESLSAEGLRSRSRANLGELEERFAREEPKFDIPNMRAQLEKAIQELALVHELQSRLQGLADIQQKQIAALRGETANLDAAAIKASIGDVCPVCFVPIDDALAQGCGISLVRPDPQQVADDKRGLEAKISGHQDAIRGYQRQLREAEAKRKALEIDESKSRVQIKKAEEDLRATSERHRQEWLVASRSVEDARRLEETFADLEGKRAQIGALTDREGRLKEDLEAHRQKHADAFARFSNLFEYVCRALLGNETNASLTLTGQGVRAEVQVGGTAMESLKAAAFDVAAMLMSMEGRTSLPAFLIHDSPREADLGLSHYHKLFHLMSKLEQGAASPPFQYIVTTTTDPPADLIDSEAVVLRLQGLETKERLLRRAL